MKTSALLLVLLTSCAFAADEPNTLTDAEKAAGWKLLFDGKTTAGWVGLGKDKFPDKGWDVVDGTLHHGKGGGDIVTAEAFENFELVWDWKIAPKANSGLKYNLPDPKKGVGFEYQLLDDAAHPDAKTGRKRQTASLYDVLESAPEANAKPPGEWNQSRIVVNGNKVEHWLNGVKSVEFEMGSEALKAAIAQSKFKGHPTFGQKAKSPILLQDHGDEIWLRSMKLRPL